MKKFSTYAFTVLLSFTLSSCGYQLRGSADLIGLDKARIVSDSRSNVSKILEQKFSSNSQSDNVNISEYPVIEVISITRDKRQLSVNSSGRVDEYEITKVLNYQFIFSETKKVVGSIKASASYDFNESQMQGTKEREKIADNSIDRTLVRKLINRYKSLSKSKSY